jgi:hypothetical protein
MIGLKEDFSTSCFSHYTDFHLRKSGDEEQQLGGGGEGGGALVDPDRGVSQPLTNLPYGLLFPSNFLIATEDFLNGRE